MANHSLLLSPVSLWHGYLELSNWSHCAITSREAKWQLTKDPLSLSSYTSTNRPHPLPKVLQLYSATKKCGLKLTAPFGFNMKPCCHRWPISDKRWLYELFICVSRREKKLRGANVCIWECDLTFSTPHCHSVFLAQGLGPSHIHNKKQNASLLQLKFLWHNLSAVIFSLCICLRKTLASILHSCRDQSHRATQKSWRTPQAQTCL